MNLEIIKTGAVKMLGSKTLLLKKHGPAIMVFTGVIGMGLAVVEGSRATLKLEGILDEHHTSLELVEDYKDAADEDGNIELINDIDDSTTTVSIQDLDSDYLALEYLIRRNT